MVDASADANLHKLNIMLQAFSNLNAYSKIEQVGTKEEERFRIAMPWGDVSLAINLDEKNDELINALNSVFLPQRYSAVWHADTKDFEIIFTAFPLGEELQNLIERSFIFSYRTVDYKCELRQASKRVVAIAAAYEPIAQSVTGFRNLASLKMYVAQNSSEEKLLPFDLDEPISFWIRNIEWDEDRFLNFVNELNFYMTYFDNKSPVIQVHSPKLESFVNQPQTRFRSGEFPATIRARELDENMLRYWGASRSGDPASRFLYSYR